MDDDLNALAKTLSQWHVRHWQRWIDPRVSEGELSIWWFGGDYSWTVKTRATLDKEPRYPSMVELAKGASPTMEEAQAAAEAAWAEKGPGLREKEISATRKRIEAEQANLKALEAARG